MPPVQAVDHHTVHQLSDECAEYDHGMDPDRRIAPLYANAIQLPERDARARFPGVPLGQTLES